MSFKEPKFEIPLSSLNEEERIKQSKEEGWRELKEKVDRTADALGEKVDEGIKETVVAFNAIGLPTLASCEGHLDHGSPAPWIEIGAPDEPEERFIGEKAVFEKVANKYSISVEDVKSGRYQDALRESFEELLNFEETPEYQQWRQKNKALEEKTQQLLEEFYRERKVPKNIRLIISKIGGGGIFRVHNGGKDWGLDLEKLTSQERKAFAFRLLKYQKEMKKFTEFLRDKYFKE